MEYSRLSAHNLVDVYSSPRYRSRVIFVRPPQSWSPYTSGRDDSRMLASNPAHVDSSPQYKSAACRFPYAMSPQDWSSFSSGRDDYAAPSLPHTDSPAADDSPNKRKASESRSPSPAGADLARDSQARKATESKRQRFDRNVDSGCYTAESSNNALEPPSSPAQAMDDAQTSLPADTQELEGEAGRLLSQLLADKESQAGPPADEANEFQPLIDWYNASIEPSPPDTDSSAASSMVGSPGLSARPVPVFLSKLIENDDNGFMDGDNLYSRSVVSPFLAATNDSVTTAKAVPQQSEQQSAVPELSQREIQRNYQEFLEVAERRSTV